MERAASPENLASVLIGTLIGSIFLLLVPSLAKSRPLFLIGLAGAIIALLVILLSEKRKEILLGLLSFSVPLAAMDKWFLKHPHQGEAVGIQMSFT
jgi:uncharacterized membrane protein (GlpM family)